jgi:hypothetical protein
VAKKATSGSKKATSPRRGRPVGSLKLTPEIEAVILTYIEAGAADYVAAEAAGIDARTFRDYLQRARGTHPNRRATDQLTHFAKAVMEAKARARAAREIEAAEHNVTFWLTHMARSKPDREGWTDPVESATAAVAEVSYQPSMEEVAQTLRVLIDAGVLNLPTISEPSSADPQDGPEND